MLHAPASPGGHDGRKPSGAVGAPNTGRPFKSRAGADPGSVRRTGLTMSSFDRWFLLVYTGYTVASIIALMWVAGDGQQD